MQLVRVHGRVGEADYEYLFVESPMTAATTKTSFRSRFTTLDGEFTLCGFDPAISNLVVIDAEPDFSLFMQDLDAGAKPQFTAKRASARAARRNALPKNVRVSEGRRFFDRRSVPSPPSSLRLAD